MLLCCTQLVAEEQADPRKLRRREIPSDGVASWWGSRACLQQSRLELHPSSHAQTNQHLTRRHPGSIHTTKRMTTLSTAHMHTD